MEMGGKMRKKGDVNRILRLFMHEKRSLERNHFHFGIAFGEHSAQSLLFGSPSASARRNPFVKKIYVV